MPRKSIAELIAQATADFPDNVSQLITPAKLRLWALDFLNAISPAYGYLSAAGPLNQTFNIAPSMLSFDTATDFDPSQTTSNATTDTITRAEKGVSIIYFNANFACPNGIQLTFALYKDGVITPWRVSAAGRGAANPVGVAMTAIDRAPTTPPVFTVQVTAEQNGVVTTLTAMSLVVSVHPVRTFT